MPKIAASITIDEKAYPFSSIKKKITSGIKNETISNPVPYKYQTVNASYNEVSINIEPQLSFNIRIYNDGIAYRHISTFTKKEVIINQEKADISFADDAIYFFPKEDNIISHYERTYNTSPIDALKVGDFCSLPLLVKSGETSVLVTETDLFDYPNLFLEKATASKNLQAKFPKEVLEIKAVSGNGSDRNELLVKEAAQLARTKGQRNFPWRVFIIGSDKEIVASHLAYTLASAPDKNTDFSWVQPGKVAWDWYNANMVYNVNFKAGLNTETYKYYVDFAHTYGLNYIILDEGWSKSSTDVTHASSSIDLPNLIQYAKDKNVGVILWLLWKPLDQNIETILDTYQSWGVKGIKVDFMQRADQYMVNYYERVAAACAKRKLLVDFHGAYKPAGLQRKYPNVVNHEGVKGNENNKWSNEITPAHTVTIPFIRMAAGFMDFTPGAMRNAHKNNFAISFYKPSSLGTRAHQVAMYIVYESPLQMLCDAPSAYIADEKTPSFIAKIPTTWHDTKILEGKVGNYIVLARKNGSNWYIGGMTDEDQRQFDLDLSFLGEGTYNATIYKDGTNSDLYAEDYSIETINNIQSAKKMHIDMHKGGGISIILTKVK